MLTWLWWTWRLLTARQLPPERARHDQPEQSERRHDEKRAGDNATKGVALTRGKVFRDEHTHLNATAKAAAASQQFG